MSDEQAVGAGDAQRRDKHLDIRMTGGEMSEVQARAQALGIAPSVWARAALLDALDARREQVRQLEQLAARPKLSAQATEAIERLRRIGVTLNALRRDAAMARKSGSEYSVVVDDVLLDRAIDELATIRDSLGDGVRT